jgi:DNA-binding transcriptional LysR family regulator
MSVISDMNYRRMDLNLLRVFDVLMSEGNVTRAAAKLNITQPAVSNALSRLRDTVDDPLFEKTASGIRPTPKAQELWASLRGPLSAIKTALEPTGFDPLDSTATFAMMCSDYVADRVLPKLLHLLEAQAPGIVLNCVPNTIVNLPPALERGEIDFAVSVYVDESQRPTPLETRALWTVEYGCLMRRDHPLTQGTMTIERFLEAAHLDVSLAGRTMPSYDDFLATRGLARNLKLTVNHYLLAPRILSCTDYIGVLPVDLAGEPPYRDALCVLPVPLPAPPRQVKLVWHKRSAQDPAHHWLKQRVIELFGTADPIDKIG